MSLQVMPLSKTFGAEVAGIDLSQPIPPAVGAELRELFFRHKVLVFHDQVIEPEHHIAFMSLINKVIVVPEVTQAQAAMIPTAARYYYISNTELGTDGPVADEFCYHADYQFTPQGSVQGLSLWAQELEQNAPTTFANMVNAAATLPADLRKQVDSLFVDNLLRYAADTTSTGRSRMSSRKPGEPNSMYPHAIHPVIERHPVTGEEYLDVSQMFSSHIVGWSDAASDELFAELEKYAYAPENLYQHNWRLHDLIVWDNIALQHKRERAEISGGRRTLRRVVVNPVELGVHFAAAEAEEWEPPRDYGLFNWEAMEKA